MSAPTHFWLFVVSPLSAIPSAAIRVHHDFIFDFYHPLTLPPRKTIVSCFSCASCPGMHHLHTFLCCGCLFLVCCCVIIRWRPPKVTLYFFSSFQFGGQNNWMVSPPCFRPPPPASAIESLYRFHQLSVDCCVASSNGSHLRPRPHLSLYFLMGLAFAPQTREPTVRLPNRMVRALHGPIKSKGAMSFWRCCHTHRESIGQSHWRVG